MEWLKQLNDALDYLEKNMDGTIDFDAAAKLACCSTFHFQRLFSYIAGVPISEYIRRRRMTAAAFDLQRGDKVLDVSLRYGYGSPTSFNRAFQSVHGVAPSAAQKEGAALKAFPRISFKISIKGEVEMEYRIEKKEAFRIVGIREDLDKDFEKNSKAIPSFWGEAAASGAVEKLVRLMDGSKPMGVLGVNACGSGVGMEEEWAYYIAVSSQREITAELSAEIPGLCEYRVSAGIWGVFPGEGSMPDSIQEMGRRIMTEWFPTSGYEYADAPDIEVYLDPNPAEAKFEIWVPIREKSK